MKLTQKKLFLKKVFEIKEDSLLIRMSDLTNSSEVTIPFEDINITGIVKQKTTDTLMLIITILFFVFFIGNLVNPSNYKNNENPFGVVIFLFLVSLICGLITYLKSKNLTLIQTSHGKFIEFFNNKPNKNQQEKFIEELKCTIANFLKSKYSKIDFDLPKEPQLMNFSWLKSMKIITDQEFEDLKNKLLGKKNNENIGFN